MTYLDKLQRIVLRDGRIVVGASFRGVPFLVETADRSSGRRVVVHEFPQRDTPYVEDLGRTVRNFRVDGYLVGDDYLANRDDLLAALEDTSGPGELVHPHYGRLQAVCVSVTVRESLREGRTVGFQIDFVEAPDQPSAPIESADLTAGVLITAESALLEINTEIEENYDATNAPAYSIASLQDELTDRTTGLREALGRVGLTTAELALLDLEVNTLIGDVTTLIRSPSATMAAFAGVLATLSDTLTSAPGRVVDALVDAYNTAEQAAVLGASAIKLQEAVNLAALTAALKRTLVVEAAKLLPSVDYETTDDARVGVTQITTLIDEQAATAGDATYGALQDLRAAVTTAVPGDTVLARVITVSRPVATPSLVLSYQLYGTVERETEIIDRNGVRDPAFIVGDIEALSV